ncbi:MAG: endonuclease Q family protein [Clostridia bacterium]|nr:endonuclease Q family protein [Clostridia bacterium]
MNQYFVDLHVHIGRDSSGRPVKVTGARNLTAENIARECATRKGIDLVAVVDCASRRVIADIERMLESGEMIEAPGGGMRCLDTTTVLLGAEVEVACPRSGSAHYLSLFSSLPLMRRFSDDLGKHMRNVDLSTQKARMSPIDLATATRSLGGLFIVAHAFTPHRSLYGTCARRMSDVFEGVERSLVSGVELGLSADADMADRISELEPFTFVSNSDAHSLPKIGREYNIVQMESPCFDELALALSRTGGRRVVANYGLDPRLGKYHLSACEECGARFHAARHDVRGNDATAVPSAPRGNPGRALCPHCGSARIVKGVSDRVEEIADTAQPVRPAHRPPYHYQIPLEFIPGVGPRAMASLIDAFGTEMAVLHRAKALELATIVGETLARRIVLARAGELDIQAGGGGAYGKPVYG